MTAVALVFTVTISTVDPSQAAIIDLSQASQIGIDHPFTAAFTHDGSEAIVRSITEIPSTGTGVINSFLRVQTNNKTYDPNETNPSKITFPGNTKDNEQGYNTSIRPITDIRNEEANTDPNFTRAILLSEVPVVKIDDKYYLEFLLDLNEPKGSDAELITLNQVQIFLGDDDIGLSSSFVASTVSQPPLIGFSGYEQIFQMGKVPPDLGDYPTFPQVLLNADLNPGSGKGDMFLYVPYKLAWSSATYQDKNVVFFTQFGNFPASPDGAQTEGTFEEWSVLDVTQPVPFETPLPGVPEPASLAIWALGLGIAGVASRRRLRANWKHATS